MSEFVFTKADISQVPRIWEIILQAKAQMKRAGSTQWQDGYPLHETIEQDIAAGVGFVILSQGTVIAYGAVSFDSEPAYNELIGTWLSQQSYVVVHRLAVADERKHQGIARGFFEFVEQYALQHNVHSFRVDTNYDNLFMLRLMQSLHFTDCGKVYYGIRGERMAFEKLL